MTPTASTTTSAQDAYRKPDRLIAALQLKLGDSVAEIGAGGGYLTPRLANAVGGSGHIVATDIDGEALAALKQRVASAPQVTVRKVSADEPGLSDEKFDVILLAQVDHLLKDRVAYLKALRPSLRPNGRIAVSNSERHREALQTAALQAGFHVEEIRAELPAQFLLLLRQ